MEMREKEKQHNKKEVIIRPCEEMNNVARRAKMCGETEKGVSIIGAA